VSVSGNQVRSQRLLSWEVPDQLCRKASIASLPNDVLLEIFNSCLYPQNRHSFNSADSSGLDEWHTLVHVCQRWRYVTFASPRRLNLRLQCTNKTPVRKRLGIWPEIPIVVSCHSSSSSSEPLPGVLNIDAALKRVDRVCEINLFGVPKPLLKRFGAMEVSFPALTCLRVSSKPGDRDNHSLPTLPDSFLGESAPRLRLLELDGVPFPAPQKLLLSTTNLITLRLERITGPGYISPEDMVTCLSTLTKLEELALGFLNRLESYRSQTNQTLPPITPIVMPALTSFRFRGHREVLDVLTSQIRYPLLDNVDITLFYQAEFNSTRFREFISRIETLELLQRADILFHDDFVNITLSRPEGPADCRTLKFALLYSKSSHQSLSLSRFCRFSLPPLPALEHLYIHCSFPGGYYCRTPQELDLLRPFASVKDLHLFENAGPRTAHALATLSEANITEVLPSLQNIFLLESKPSETIRIMAQFIFTRSLSGSTISIHFRQGGNWVAKLLREVDN